MNILLVGGGGREHALARQLSRSPHCRQLFAAPGNAGIWELASILPFAATETKELADIASDHDIDLTVVGPDDPLALGIVDTFKKRNLKIFGPTQAAARIESSKAFAKQVMREAGVPTADFQVFDNYHLALWYVRARGGECVIKADGLALGKGVYVCSNLPEAEQALQSLMDARIHGSAGDTVVIEERLYGQEISIHALCSGRDFLLLPTSQDHKRVGEGDTGKNTGGMGTIAPVPWITDDHLTEIRERIVQPTLNYLADRGTPFVGCLYPGLMLTQDGFKVLEFNARFGDPETQSLMRLLDTDLVELLLACVESRLHQVDLKLKPGAAACVVLASEGYPGTPKKGAAITGIKEAERLPGVMVYQAGTQRDGGRLVTAGGRVLNVTAVGANLEEARSRAYAAVDLIHFEGKFYRRDIGLKALNR